MIATTGAHLLPASALRILHARLLPLATIVTPNVPEALRLLENATTGTEENGALAAAGVRTVDDLVAIARAIRRLGPRWVLVKGGHCPFRADGTAAREGAEGERERVVDVLVGGGGEGEEVVVKMETGYCETRHTHGTGCSLACEFFFSLDLFFAVKLKVVCVCDMMLTWAGWQRRSRQTWQRAWRCRLR